MTEREARTPRAESANAVGGEAAPGDAGARAASERVTALVQAAFGPATRLGGGHHSRVYGLRDGCVLKVYRHSNGLHRHEADNMRAAGLSNWVLGVSELADLELLLLRSFPGGPVTASNLPEALPSLSSFLGGLHRSTNGLPVDLGPVRLKLKHFHESLPQLELRPLFDCIHSALAGNLLDSPASYCHLDLWSANVLYAAPGRVLVVDWARAAFDDPARDIAILKTGTLDLLTPDAAWEAAKSVCGDAAVAARLPAYLALQTLHDLYWFQRHQPAGYPEAYALKVPRALSDVSK